MISTSILIDQRAYLSSDTSSKSSNGNKHQRTSSRVFRMRRMSDDDRVRKQAEIDAQRDEQKPHGLYQLFKYYLKRYWYIAIGVHCISSIVWFTAAYVAVAK